MSLDREISGEVLRRRERWTKGSLAAVLLVVTIAGGKAGYEANQNERASRDADNIAAAERNQRCLELSHTQRTVNLSGLSDEEKKDCGLENVEKQLQPRNKNGGWERLSLPDGTEIVPGSIDVRLPSPGVLQASRDENLRKSIETSVPEHVEIVAATGAGAAGGLIALSAVGAMGLSLVGSASLLAGRRQP